MTMATTVEISVDDIGGNLQRYLELVEAGQSLTILRAGKAVAEIKPVPAGDPALRPFGLCAGEFTVPDNFDEPLPESIVEVFEGSREKTV
jgi:antitoxin (DNA-binding transcriptional repressor) of toxin-antitoxin stability system